MTKQTVLLVGREQENLARLEAALKLIAGAEIRARVISNGHMDPLHGVETMPTVLVLLLSRYAEEELGSLAVRPAASRPATLVVAPEDNPELMRKAMRAGARDFIAEPYRESELRASVERILADEDVDKRRTLGRIAAVINAKGGSGATFIASSIAHVLRNRANQRVALIDLDFQFPSLTLQLDIKPKLSLLDALLAIDELDPLALDAYLGRHKSGLALLSPSTEQLMLPGEADPVAVKRIVALAAQSFDQVVCDLPRQIDPVNAAVLEMAQTVVLVLQQSVAHVRDAKRLMRILLSEFDVPKDRISVVVNRFDPKSRLKLQDLKNVLEVEDLQLIRNDFETVDAAINLGIPICEHAPHSAVAKSLIALAEHVGCLEGPLKRPGTWRWALSHLWS